MACCVCPPSLPLACAHQGSQTITPICSWQAPPKTANSATHLLTSITAPAGLARTPETCELPTHGDTYAQATENKNSLSRHMDTVPNLPVTSLQPGMTRRNNLLLPRALASEPGSHNQLPALVHALPIPCSYLRHHPMCDSAPSPGSHCVVKGIFQPSARGHFFFLCCSCLAGPCPPLSATHAPYLSLSQCQVPLGPVPSRIGEHQGLVPS